MTKLFGVALLLMLGGCATTHATGNEDAAVRDHPERYLVVAVHNEAESGNVLAGSTARGYTGGGSYAQSARARNLLRDIARDYQLQAVNSWPIQALAMECVVFKPVNGIPNDALIEKLQHDPRVMLAQPLQSFATSTTPPPDQTDPPPYNDSYVSLQQGMQRMGADDAHQWSRGHGVSIAVVDTGMDSSHPDLKGRIGEQRNFVDNNQSQFVKDRHGTAVAGVIAADTNNRHGIIGVAPEAKLIALKACWQLQVDRDDARCNSFTLAQALASAIELHAQIINLSVVGPNDPLLDALIKQAQHAGIIVVGATDAEGHATFPAQLPDVIGVAAMEQPVTDTQVVNAPGRDVLTLRPGGHYDFSSGSSIATAEISGTVALLLASHTNGTALDSEHLRTLLLQSTETDASDKLSSVNACRALAQLLKQSSGCDHRGEIAKSDAAR